ncbi:MAG: molybdopterin-dependent oxidoreductase [Acidobacteriota bacterium]|nr:molybdopterin-dependent oxidoreductase [Acidobacteriota bacterium]
MSTKPFDEFSYEPERYELKGEPAYRFEMARRDFFKSLGGGILIVFALKTVMAQNESGGARRGGNRGGELPQDVGAWLHIGEDGAVTAYTGKVEMGQDIRTSLAQAVAEELRAPLASISLLMGDTDLTPFDMGTFGSRTTPTMNPQLRRAAAAARELLIDLAADQLKVERGSLVLTGGRITHPQTKRSLNFGDLTKGQKLVKAIDSQAALTPADKWEVAGKSAQKVSGRDIVRGRHRYTSDIKRPGMLYGKVLRPATIGATLSSVDTKGAEAWAGVVLVRDGDFVGVAAPTMQQAAQAISAIHADWKSTAQPSSAEIFDFFKKGASEGEGGSGRPEYERGSISEGLAAAQQKLERKYTVAYIAHAPLEPRAAVAEWTGGKLTVWTGTQRPFGVRSELSEAFHIPETQVRVIVPDTGSAYGGKHTGEVAVEAARLAKAAGRPVKLTWSREEEFTWAYFRPAGLIEVTSGVAADGRVTAWEFHNYNSGSAGIRTPYDVQNQRIEFHAVRSPLRQGSYRALAATANNFSRETHMDELAKELKVDPLEFRRRNLKDERLLAVLDAAAKAFGWGKSSPRVGKGAGLACGTEKGGYVATCAEVAVDREGGLKVLRVVTAFECGAIVNPDGLKNQVEGAIIQGLGGALFESIKFEGGKILNPRFSL